MEWFSQKTSIAGIQIPNWGIVLGAIIVILLIYTVPPLSRSGFKTGRLGSEIGHDRKMPPTEAAWVLNKIVG